MKCRMILSHCKLQKCYPLEHTNVSLDKFVDAIRVFVKIIIVLFFLEISTSVYKILNALLPSIMITSGSHSAWRKAFGRCPN